MSTGITRCAVRRILLLASLAAAVIVIPAPAAIAACHAFTIAASPTTVAEGGKVTVTVGRDGNVGSSRVDVRTVDGSAKSGRDFTGGTRTISFTSEKSKTFTIPIINDTAPEDAETFRVELVTDSGGGCTINPRFTYGPPVTVTIGANDQPAAARSPAPRRASATMAPAGGTTQSASATPTGNTSPPATTRPTATTTPVPPSPLVEPTLDSGGAVADSQSTDDGGPSTGLIAIAVVLLATVLAGAAAYLQRRRHLGS